MAYAQRTKVPIERTKTEIESELRKHKADRFAYLADPDRAVVAFELEGRRIRFVLPLPVGEKLGDQQERRALWRALFLCIKAKLESVVSGIETFEEAFLAHVVMPDGKTVYEHTSPRLAEIAKSGKSIPLLPSPESRP